MEALDALAAQAVLAARAFERAVHDPGPWSITLDRARVAPARRVRLGASVKFVAAFPPACRVSSGPVLGTLSCGGDEVSVRLLDVPDDEGPLRVVWEVGVPAAVRA